MNTNKTNPQWMSHFSLHFLSTTFALKLQTKNIRRINSPPCCVDERHKQQFSSLLLVSCLYRMIKKLSETKTIIYVSGSFLFCFPDDKLNLIWKVSPPNIEFVGCRNPPTLIWISKHKFKVKSRGILMFNHYQYSLWLNVLW